MVENSFTLHDQPCLVLNQNVVIVDILFNDNQAIYFNKILQISEVYIHVGLTQYCYISIKVTLFLLIAPYNILHKS